jgi:hypothetical protein
VTLQEGEICFRLWNLDDPDLWETHGWVPYAAIMEAQKIYQGRGFDPKTAYDIRAARALLDEEKRRLYV